MIKLIVPIEYKEVVSACISIVNVLLWRGRRFSIRMAHHGRKDTICIWIKREELDPVVMFLGTLSTLIMDAPFYYPRYKSIAITRESKQSINEHMTFMLERYLSYYDTTSTCSLEGLLEKISPCYDEMWTENGQLDFGYQILMKSLYCIEYDICLTAVSPYNIVDFLRREFN